jgi:hypothetical protein
VNDNTLAYGPTGRPQLMATRCATCILRRDGGLVPPAVTRDLIARHRAAGALVTCHETLPWGPHPEMGASACRGFYDAYRGENIAAKVADRLLGGFDELPAPADNPKPLDHDSEPNRQQVS